jgi:predicted TIM-barrel fold metal-dependent hydrolase
MAGVRQMLDSMDEAGVDISVIFGFPWKNSDLFKQHNDYILEAVEKHPKRLIGFCCFDLKNKDAASEARRCVEGGASGVGELAFYDSEINGETLKKLEPIMDMCREMDLPVLIHTNEPIGHIYPGKMRITLQQIYDLIKKFSKNKIVLAHWGGGIFFFHLLKKEVKKYFTNIFLDTAASPFLYDTEIYPIAIQIIGMNKILFGSDFPLLRPGNYLKKLKNIGLSKEETDRICGRNAAGLLKLTC